jgi:hypothetical protein
MLNMSVSDLRLFEDSWYSFVAPVICFCSLFTNLINANVLVKVKRMDKIYHYMYIKTIINSIYLAICSFVFLFKCGQFCDFKTNYVIKMYELYMYMYYSSCLAMLELLIEITISLNRYVTISNNKCFRFINGNVMIVSFFLISFSFYLPILFLYKVDRVNKPGNMTDAYTMQYIEMNNDYKIEVDPTYEYHLKLLETVGLSLRGILIVALIIILNVLCFLKHKNNVDNIVMMDNLNTTVATSHNGN